MVELKNKQTDAEADILTMRETLSEESYTEFWRHYNDAMRRSEEEAHKWAIEFRDSLSGPRIQEEIEERKKNIAVLKEHLFQSPERKRSYAAKIGWERRHLRALYSRKGWITRRRNARKG